MSFHAVLFSNHIVNTLYSSLLLLSLYLDFTASNFTLKHRHQYWDTVTSFSITMSYKFNRGITDNSKHNENLIR